MFRFKNGTGAVYSVNNPIFNKIGLFFTVIILLVILSQLLFFLRPWQKIKEAKVSTFQMDYRQVLKKINLNVGDPYWLWVGQEQAVKNRVKNDRTIRSISMKMNQKGFVTVTVTENLTTGYIQKGQHWYRLDQNAKSRSGIVQPDGQAPVYTNFQIGSKVLKNTIKAYLLLDKVMRSDIGQIIYSPIKGSQKRLTLIMNDGNLVYINASEMNRRMDLYPQMLATMEKKGIQTGVIDLEYGGGFARKFQDSDKHLLDSASYTKNQSSQKSSSSKK